MSTSAWTGVGYHYPPWPPTFYAVHTHDDCQKFLFLCKETEISGNHREYILHRSNTHLFQYNSVPWSNVRMLHIVHDIHVHEHVPWSLLSCKATIWFLLWERSTSSFSSPGGKPTWIPPHTLLYILTPSIMQPTICVWVHVLARNRKYGRYMHTQLYIYIPVLSSPLWVVYCILLWFTSLTHSTGQEQGVWVHWSEAPSLYLIAQPNGLHIIVWHSGLWTIVSHSIMFVCVLSAPHLHVHTTTKNWFGKLARKMQLLWHT